MNWVNFAHPSVYFPLLCTVIAFVLIFNFSIVTWCGWFFFVVRIDVFESQENGACTHYVMVSKINQWKPFWLATQLKPQNDWTGWQFRMSYDVFFCTGPILFWCQLRDTVRVKIFLCQVRSTGFEKKRLCQGSAFLFFAEGVQSCQHFSCCSSQDFFFLYISVLSKDQTSQGISEHHIFIVLFLLCFYFLAFQWSKQNRSVRSSCSFCRYVIVVVVVFVFLPFFLFFCLAVVAVHAAVDVIEKDFAKLPCIFEAQSSYLFSIEIKKKKEKQTIKFSCWQGSVRQTVFSLERSCWHCLPLFFLPSLSVLVPAVLVCFILIISHSFVSVMPSRLSDGVHCIWRMSELSLSLTVPVTHSLAQSLIVFISPFLSLSLSLSLICEIDWEYFKVESNWCECMLTRLSLLRVVQAKMYDQLQPLCLLSITSGGMSKKITFHAPLFDQSWLVDPSPERNSTAEC